MASDDYNILGITAPTNTRRTSWETVRDDLKSFLQQSPAPAARLAHVEGPHGSGKSTSMLEYIWDEVHSSNPETVVVYVPAFGPETLLLHSYFESTASAQAHIQLKGKTLLNLRRTGMKPMLYLATVPELQAVLRQDLNHGVFPEHVVILLDLELSPTADGELLLSQLCLWYRGRLSRAHDAARRQSQLTLITMADFSRPPLHKLLEDHIQTRCYRIVMKHGGGNGNLGSSASLSMRDLPLNAEPFPKDTHTALQTMRGLVQRILVRKEPETLPEKVFRAGFEQQITSLYDSKNSSVKVGQAMVELLDTAVLMPPHPKKSPCIVFFYNTSTDDEFLQAVGGLCTENNVDTCYIGVQSSLLEIVEAVVSPKPRVICIESDFPVVLHIPRIAAIVSFNTTCQRVAMDAYTGQLAIMETLRSRMDLVREQSYALKSTLPGADHMDADFYCTTGIAADINTDDHFDKWRLVPDSPAYGNELMRLSLELCSSWPDPQRESGEEGALLPLLPIPAILDIYLLTEMWRRLVQMGCLRLTSRRPVPNGPRALRTLEALDYDVSRQFNQDRQVPLAYFVTGIKDMASVPVKRVMIRIAVCIDAGGDSIIHPKSINDALQDLENDPSSDNGSHVLAAIAADCRGVGEREFMRGDVWIRLGLLLRQEKAFPAIEENDEEETYSARIKTYLSALAKVRVLETQAGLDPPEDPIRDTELQPSEIDAVNSELLRSWLHHIVWLHREGSETTVIDLTSYQPVETEGFSSLVIRRRFETGIGPGSDLFAFSHMHIKTAIGRTRSSALWLTEIPSQLMRNLMREHGWDFLQTKYPRAPRP
ncbi:hypothetical protein F4821DRAFT_278348 [Hypoxylon rubiginosum]|uniref:Uncharacterized protein n=1 Tax=Hypoxylon rubiginosum TaxID=110542 RepID=A0ACC0D2D2_9PEZI|nr:hypothetical protein F4821DRAFT_278348 [Hypoxylon rubiginosum]